MADVVMVGDVRAELVHAIPGRLRVRIEQLRTVPGFADGFVHAFMAHPGILSVRVNSWCASAIITYDPAMLTLQDARRTLESTHAVPASPSQRSATPPAPVGTLDAAIAPFRRVSPPWAQFATGTAALAAGLLGLPAALTLGLTVLATAPIGGRAVLDLVRGRRPGVDTLDLSAAALMIVRRDLRAAAFMTALIGLGEVIRDRTARRSQALIADLLGLGGRSAWVVHGRQRVRVPAEQVRVGETVVVYPGDMVPVDGVVTRGHAAVDQRTLTGESMPVEIGPGDHAFAATVLVEGKVYMRCEAAGGATRAGAVVDLVRSAPLYETRTQNYASMIASRLVLPIFGVAALSFALTRDITRVVSVLIIDFATGIRIAAPTAILASMQRAARRGILIKGGGAVERLAAIDAVMFDKTGTLTRGDPEVTEVVSVSSLDARQVLLLAAAAEQRLRHPAARAIVRHARRAGLVIPERGGSHYTLGMGVRAEVEGVNVLVGSRRLMESEGIAMGPVEEAQASVRARGESLSYVAADGELAGMVAYNDPLRPEARAVIAGLRRRGVREIVMVTGDNPAPAAAAAADAGITEVVAGAFPEEKAEVVKAMKARGRTVAVVGDGINDSPALAHADVAVSLHGASDIARERADVVLTDDDLRRLPEAIDIARGAMGLVRENLAIVAVPNGLGLALGALGRIGPGVATLANNGSAVVAALNSLRPLLAGASVPVEQPALANPVFGDGANDGGADAHA